MIYVYAFKQLEGENEIDYHFSAQNKIENIVFLNIWYDWDATSSKLYWFKVKKLESNPHKCH